MSPGSEQKLFLIDGYALIYRAFFAMIARPLRTSRGENTSAVWGVASFLDRLLAQHVPTYAAWVHDAGTSFRNTFFPEYKATREKLDAELQEDFDRSIERTVSLLDAFGVSLVEVDGYEADDVIGTLAERASEVAVPVVIVSGDKDFYQLVSSNVTLLNPGRGGPAAVEEQIVTLSNASDRFGIGPERVVDYLALVGDSSDNVPGVRGIGDKTARKLIHEYGDLESILAHASDVKGKRVREALLAEAENARLSRKLVTIRRDVPVPFDLDALRIGSPDTDALRHLYAELEFHSLMSKLGTESKRDAPAKSTIRTVAVLEGIGQLVREVRHAGRAAVTVLSAGRESRGPELVGLALAVAVGRSWYVPLGHESAEGELAAGPPPSNLPPVSDERMQSLRELLADPAVPKVGHDLKRDWLVLRRAGVQLRGIAGDTMLASFVLDPGRRSHALDVLAPEHLDAELPSLGHRTPRQLSVGEASEYACARCDTVLRLLEHFDAQLKATRADRLLREIELALVGVLVEMELRGVRLDTEQLRRLSQEFSSELAELERAIYREAGTEFNINSTPQLRHVLFEKLGLPVVKKTKTGPSTDAGVLATLTEMEYALPRLLLEYRELSKLVSTYVDALAGWVDPATGRVHTSFNQTGASTGRLSSSDPNLQNIPVRTARGERIRRCFVPAEGWRLIVADYSQIELRLLAHLSHDEAFIGAFKRGGDIHTETAAIIFDVAEAAVTEEMRTRAKTINFATIYGQGPYSLSRQLGVSQPEAKEFIRLYFERFAGVRRFLDQMIQLAREQGYVETLFGRRRYIPELRDSTHNIRAFGERIAMNSPLQGSAADLIKLAMVRLADALEAARLRTAIVLQVHDELVLEAPAGEVDEAVVVVRREMEGVAALDVPLVVDIGEGDNWLAAKP